jgi:hypothetical protein
MDGTCAATQEECAACPAGTVDDCSGDGDCCFETWVGDGYCDDETQAYGCDLMCYEAEAADCDGRNESALLRTFNKGETLSSSVAGRVVDVIRAETMNPVSLRDGVVVHNSGEAVRIGQVISSSSRELVATVAFECLEGYNAGFTGSWDADPALGTFTVYGWDASDVVCATLSFCDGGACGESSGPLCVSVGNVDEQSCQEGGSDCETAGTGDVNGDGSADVLDIVQIVNVILGGDFADDCAAESADINGDGSADVLDIVQIVNMILGGRSSVDDATTGSLIRSNNTMRLEANGYIGGVQMTLRHGSDFSIDLTNKSMLSEYNTVDNTTTLVIVTPESDELFTYTGDFQIVDVLVASSSDKVDIRPTRVSLSAAHPNPFNPTTSLELAVPVSGHVSVQVYNLMGQVVATLTDGFMEANTYKTLTWDASNVSSGMYLVKAQTANAVTTQKLMLLK